MAIARETLRKTEWTDTFVYCDDASQLFSFSAGCVLIQLTLPFAVRNGVYQHIDKESYFPDYLLFAVKMSGKYRDYPGIYAALGRGWN